MLQLYKNIDNNEDRSSLATMGFSIFTEFKTWGLFNYYTVNPLLNYYHITIYCFLTL